VTMDDAYGQSKSLRVWLEDREAARATPVGGAAYRVRVSTW
jgi:hypothetical protein